MYKQFKLLMTCFYAQYVFAVNRQWLLFVTVTAYRLMEAGLLILNKVSLNSGHIMLHPSLDMAGQPQPMKIYSTKRERKKNIIGWYFKKC